MKIDFLCYPNQQKFKDTHKLPPCSNNLLKYTIFRKQGNYCESFHQFAIMINIHVRKSLNKVMFMFRSKWTVDTML